MSADTIDSCGYAPTPTASRCCRLKTASFPFILYLFPLSGRRRLVFVKVVVRVQRRETATRARHQRLHAGLAERVHVQHRPQGRQHFPQSADEIGPGNDRRTRARGGDTAASGGHDDDPLRPARVCRRPECVCPERLCPAPRTSKRKPSRSHVGRRTIVISVTIVYVGPRISQQRARSVTTCDRRQTAAALTIAFYSNAYGGGGRRARFPAIHSARVNMRAHAHRSTLKTRCGAKSRFNRPACRVPEESRLVITIAGGR